jgi:uncharacterized membrane protein
MFTLVIASSSQAKDDSLFPKADAVNIEKPSLNSAIAQFEGIIENSADGDTKTLKSNNEYNQQQMSQLQQQLVEKKKYLETLPGLVSRQFDDLMKQYADSDQATKNKMAADLHAKWTAKEADVRREIVEIEEQLGITTNRVSELAIKSQLLEISNSLAQSEKAFRQQTQEKENDPQAESPEFKNLRDLSRRRILSKIHAICPIDVKSLHADFSVKHLDN